MAESEGLSHEGVPPEAFFALAFSGPMPEGNVTFHESFMAQGPTQAWSVARRLG